MHTTKEEAKKSLAPDLSLINDIGTVLRFVKEDFGGLTGNLESLLSKGEITFDLVWAIFPPREFVVALEHGTLRQPQALAIATADYGSYENGGKYSAGQGKIITHDGEDFGKASFVPVIEAFEGSHKVTSLEFYPIKYHADEVALRNRLIARGKRYMKFLEKPAPQEYTLHYAIAENQTTARRSERESQKIRVCPSQIT